MGTTVHFVTGIDFHTIKLGVIRMTDSHTADKISREFKNLLTKWGIEDHQVAACVTDNAANILKATSDTFGVKRQIGCFAHSLNLVMENSVHCIAPIIDKVKAVVTFSRQSSEVRSKLERLQVGDERQHKIKDYVATRWNSVYTMLKRFVELAPDLVTVLYNFEKAPPMPSTQELQICSELVSLMAPLNEATVEMSGENYVTVSKVIPIVACIHNCVSGTTATSPLAKDLKVKLLQELEFRFANIETKAIYAKATILDPRYKRVHFKRAVCAANAVQAITREVMDDSNNVAIDPPSNEATPSTLWESHDKMVQMAELSEKNDDSQNVADEIHHYLSAKLKPRDTNPLEFWRENCLRYKFLHKVANKYLAIVATSVPAERLFSNAGDIMRPERNQLSDENLNNLVFLHGVPEEIFFK
jgi:hAT family C-terminal dimerisation region